ncbi:MAG: hypothetical protein MRZ79_26625 [Bacteroidia bacterium]|nr:hypothetical protein [Bacteroidia bacterium]
MEESDKKNPSVELMKNVNELMPSLIPVMKGFFTLKETILRNYPELNENEAEELASSVITEIAQRLKSGEQLAFLKYENEDEVVLTQFAFEKLNSKTNSSK